MSPRTQRCAKCGDSRLPADLVLRPQGMVCADTLHCETAEHEQERVDGVITPAHQAAINAKADEDFDRYEELQERGS